MTIEQELFSWDGWDGDPEYMIFYNPVLKVQIGKYPVGTKFACANIIQREDGTVLQLCNVGKVVSEITDRYAPTLVMGEYKLHYRVGDTISES